MSLMEAIQGRPAQTKSRKVVIVGSQPAMNSHPTQKV